MSRTLMRRAAAIAMLAVLSWSNIARAQSLDILIYGATGKIGTLVTDEALERGHKVTAVSRSASLYAARHPNLSFVQGDLLDAGSIASLVAGRDVVIISVRGVIGDKEPENALQLIAVENVVNALANLDDAPRLIHVGGAGSLRTESGKLYADRLPRIFLPNKFEAELFGQVLALQFLRSSSNIRWTYITPPRNFTNGERTGNYQTGDDTMLEDSRGRSRISRADFAVAIIDEAESGAHLGQRFSVAY